MNQRWADTLDRLFRARRSGVVLGLDRVIEVALAMGRPQRRLGRVIHVAGTNGKGSTTAFCAAMARAACLRVAVYSSPHLSTIRERVTIDGAMCDEASWQAALDSVHAHGGEALTFFEQVTLLAFVLIADAKVDLTIVEVGLGGRLDATNIVAADVAVLTGVAYDHQAYLGERLEDIAYEKAGICRAGQAVVLGGGGEPEGRLLLLNAAEKLGARVFQVGIDEARTVETLSLGLVGAHQRTNAATAVLAVRTLRSEILNESVANHTASVERQSWRRLADENTQVEGLRDTRLPGRLELIAARDPASPSLLFDTAHNPNGAQALARHLQSLDCSPIWLVLAISSDKDIAGIVAPLLGVVHGVVCTAYRGERALGAEALGAFTRTLAKGMSPMPEIVIADIAADAVRVAEAQSGPDGLVCVAGSIFLVGEIRGERLGIPADPVLVSDPVGMPSA